MSINATSIAKQISKAIQDTGDLARIKYYTATYSGGTTDWDEEYITQSGTDLWIYTTVIPVSDSKGGEDYKFMEEGKLMLNDRKIYLAGSISLSGGTIKIGLGSPIREEYSFLNEGRVPYRFGVGGSILAWKGYIRVLNTGSFFGEY